jgi:hypothetical protein
MTIQAAPVLDPLRSGSAMAVRMPGVRRIVVNAVGELVGLGLTGAVDAVAVATHGPDRRTLAVGSVVALVTPGDLPAAGAARRRQPGAGVAQHAIGPHAAHVGTEEA